MIKIDWQNEQDGQVDKRRETVKRILHQIFQNEIADRVGYQDKFCELQLSKGLDIAEDKIADYICAN